MRRSITALALAVVVGLGALAVASLAGVGPRWVDATASPAAIATGAPSVPATQPMPSATPVPSSAPVAAVADVNRSGIRVRLQEALDRARSALAAPGIVASVVFADGSTWTGVSGVADVATGRQLQPTTPFAVASISKTFLAAEILVLVDAGRLDLDASVAELLPGVQVGGRSIDPRITVRELLDHTSGLGDFLVSPLLDKAVLAAPAQVWTPTMALAFAGRPLSAPGAAFHYSNTGYVLLGLIAEAVTGRTLAAEYHDRFLGPLLLRSTFYQGVDAPTGELPTAYRYSSVELTAKPADVTYGTPIRPFTAITTAAGAAGSMAASAPDLARWVRALYGGRVLPAATIQEMVDDAARTAALKVGRSYGLGVEVIPIGGQPSYGHGGRLVGAQSVVRWFPDQGVAIAVVTNQSRFDPQLVLEQLLAVAAPRTMYPVPRAA